MAKRKRSIAVPEAEPLPPVETIGLPSPVAVRVVVVWSFPSRSRCRRCGSIQTTRTSQDGPTQYRQCQVPTCRHRYKEHGTQI